MGAGYVTSAVGRAALSEGFAFTDVTRTAGYGSSHVPVARSTHSPAVASLQQSTPEKPDQGTGQWTPGASSSSASPEKPWQASPSGGVAVQRCEVQRQIYESPVQSPDGARSVATPQSISALSSGGAGAEPVEGSAEKKKKKKKKEDKDV